jgi:CheY-like chemotaxis protein
VKNGFEKNEYSYGLIFMDCSMPVMNGYEASREIRSFVKTKHFMQPMIVAITGHTEDEYIKKAWEN